jgi:DNA adenine methylase
VERAARYMFIVNSSYGFQALGDNTFSTHIATKGGHISSIANRWTAKVNKLIWFALRFRDVIIENRDFEEIFRVYDRPEAVFFCDPPYTQGVFSWSFTEHLRLARCLKNLKGKFLLTIDDSPLSRQLYKDFNLVASFDTQNGMVLRNSKEYKTYRQLCYTNYDVKVDVSLQDDEPLMPDADGYEGDDLDFDFEQPQEVE